MNILIPIFSDAFLHPLHKDNGLSLLYVRSVGDSEGRIICINHPDCNEKETIDEIKNDHTSFYITPDVKKIKHLFPDTRLMEIPQVEINSSIEDIIKKTNPEMLFIPPENDLHTDHSKVHNCALVASRSLTNQIKQIYSYEILGHVKTPFLPNVFIDIEKFLSKKITAFKMYKSEQKEFPHHRSIKSIENLAIRRGVESGLKFAEAFRLIRAMNSF